MVRLLDVGPLVRHPGRVAALFLAVVTAAAPGLLRLRIDNAAEGFFARDATALERFDRLERTFGRDRGVRIVLAGEGLWTGRGVAWWNDLETAAARPGVVYAVAGPLRHLRSHLDPPPLAPGAIRTSLLADPLAREVGWIARDGATVTILLGLHRTTPARRDAALDGLRRLLATAPSGVETRLVGVPVVNQALDRAMVRMATAIFPALLAVAIALLALVFRSASGVAAPLALVGTVQVVVFGAIGYAGQRLDLVFVVLVPLVFVVALATGVHVLATCREALRHAFTPAAAIVATFRLKARAIVWTGLTTAAGFGSLALSPVVAVRQLGLWAAFAMSWLTVCALFLYPVILAAGIRRREPARRSAERRLASWGAGAAGVAVAAPRRIHAGFLLVAVVAALGLPRLRIDTGILEAFRPDDPARADAEALDAGGIGTTTASLVLRREGGFADGASLDALRRIARHLRVDPLARGVVGPADVATDAIGASDGRAVDWTAARERLAAVRDLADLDGFLLDPSSGTARLLLMIPMRDAASLAPLFRAAEREARARFPDATVYVTGHYPMVLESQGRILATMEVSLALTILVVAFAFAALLRSTVTTALVLVPNLWPVLIVLGTMGWTDVPVDGATVMVAAVVLGLAVDDTLHLLVHWGHGGTGTGTTIPIVGALREAAPGMAITTAILVLGFGVCAASPLLPVARFGALSAGALLGALAADLLWVPALLAGRSPPPSLGGR